MAVDRIAALSMAAMLGLGGTIAHSGSEEMRLIDRMPRKKRRKGRTLSDTPFGPPSPFETRQQRRYRLRMQAKQMRKCKQVIIHD